MSNNLIWDEIYSSGSIQRYPWDIVVSFVFRNAPRNVMRNQINILELGFGTAPNLWFASREGFSVSGVESSHNAVKLAKKRFLDESLEGDLRLGDFTDLPFDDNTFDLAIDRCSLVCVDVKKQKLAINEVNRVLKKGGRFLHNSYPDCHPSANTGDVSDGGLVENIKGGTLVGAGSLCFSSLEDINEKFAQNWNVISKQRKVISDLTNPLLNHSEWIILAEKI